MKKKKESDDILKQFYSNLSLLSPESFFFNQNLTETLLPYVQNFIKSGDNCDFGFKNKNENRSELTEISHPPNSILVPINSSNILTDENESIFDTFSKYNEYVKLFMKKNPVYSNFKKEFFSNIYYLSSQRLIFLAICHLMRPNIVQKIILRQKNENKNQNQWRMNNIFQKNLIDDDPSSFINSQMKIDDRKSGFINPSKNNSFNSSISQNIDNQKYQSFQNSILVDETFLKENEEENQNQNTEDQSILVKTKKNDSNEEENQKADNISKSQNINYVKAKEIIQNQDEIAVSKEENEILILKNEEEQSSISNKEAENNLKEIHSKNENQEKKNQSFNSKKTEDDIDNFSKNEEEEISDKFNEESKIENDNSILKEKESNELILDQKEEENNGDNENSLLNDESSQNDEFLTECSKDEIKFTKSDDDIIPNNEDKQFDSLSISKEENIKDTEKADLSKSSISFQNENNHDIRPIRHRKRQNESNFSLSHNEKLLQLANEKRIEISTTANEKERIDDIQTETEIFEYSENENEFDFDFAQSQVFDALSLSFFEMRTNMQGRITRSTEQVFERWSQISCCLFFEFVSRDFSFFSLKNNSSFSTKFEDFVRSLVQGFVSSEKQSYHDGVISLLPPESKFFYLTSLVTLDSIDRDNQNEVEKSDKKETLEESSDFLIDSKYMYYHHRRGMQITTSTMNDSTMTDSTFNTTAKNESNQTYSFSNQTGLKTNESIKHSQKVDATETDFSVSKFMNPILASYRSQKDESIESFSMKIMLAKAVHANAMKESRILFDVSEASPLISRALDLRGVTPPRKPPDPSNYSPRKLRKSEKKFSSPKEPEQKKKNEIQSPRSKKQKNNSHEMSPKPKIKVNHVNSKSKNSIQSSSIQNSIDDTFYTFNRKMKTLKMKNKNRDDEKKFQISFDPFQNINDSKKEEKLNEKKKPLKTSIRRVQLAESKGFIVREKAVEQHNRGVLNDYEVKKRAIYRDICSNEAKCAEEIEKYASNGKFIMNSNIGKAVLYDRLEKNIRNKQINKTYDRLNGRKVVYGMEYDTDFSQLEGRIATAILEDSLF